MIVYIDVIYVCYAMLSAYAARDVGALTPTAIQPYPLNTNSVKHIHIYRI